MGKSHLQRKLQNAPPIRSDFSLQIQCIDFYQLLYSLFCLLLCWLIQKAHRIQADKDKGFYLQNYTHEIRPQNLRYWKIFKFLITLLGIKSEAFSPTCPSSPSSSLLGRRLWHWNHQQLLNVFSIVEQSHFDIPGINDEIHPRNCHRSFCNICRQNDFPLIFIALKHSPLLLWRELRKELQDHKSPLRKALQKLFFFFQQILLEIQNLLLPGKENQNVSFAFFEMNLQNNIKATLYVILTWGSKVENLNGKKPSRNLHSPASNSTLLHIEEF